MTNEHSLMLSASGHWSDIYIVSAKAPKVLPRYAFYMSECTSSKDKVSNILEVKEKKKLTGIYKIDETIYLLLISCFLINIWRYLMHMEESSLISKENPIF